VIRVTRLNGDPFVLNTDLIERLEAHPDTVVTLVDGTRYVVREPVDDLIRDIQMFRAEILSWASLISHKSVPLTRTASDHALAQDAARNGN
jgi:uncharacterized protein YlzI (FlbEa/FlbD family)